MGFFSVDGALYRFMQSLTNVFIISILWLICCIPVFTFGPATIAAFSVTLKMADDREGYVGRQFIQAFKANFKTGIPYSFIFFGGAYICWLDFSLFNQLENNPLPLLIAGIVATFIFVMCFIYAFPLAARYENTVIRTLKNSFKIAERFWVRTISLAIILVIEAIIILYNEITIFVGVLIGPACIFLTISGYANFMFRIIQAEPGAVENPEDIEDNLR